jgi:hypothetical protein
MGAAGRQDPRGEKYAHPIELTAVSAIVLDLLSGFQRPSDPDAGRGRPAAGRPFYGPGIPLSSHSPGGETRKFRGIPLPRLRLPGARGEDPSAADPETVHPRGWGWYRSRPTVSTFPAPRPAGRTAVLSARLVSSGSSPGPSKSLNFLEFSGMPHRRYRQGAR